MSRFGFCGGSYTSISTNVDAELCMNRYPETVESSGGRSAMALIPKEGLAAFVSLPVGSGQSVPGGFTYAGRTFCCGVVIATQQVHLYEVMGKGLPLIDRGSLGAPLTNAPAIWAANPNQLVFTVAGTGLVYILALSTNVLSKAMLFINGVATGNQVTGLAAVGYLDGFFVGFLAGTNTILVSNLEDGTSWDEINIASVSEFPDAIVSMVINARIVWFLGLKASVPYFDSGALFPLTPVPNAYVEQGSAATYGAAKLDNTIVWIGSNPDQGLGGIAYMMNGYTPERISTHAVETAWESYPTIADAISFTYTIRGHKFWEIYFPTANATWVFDKATSLWHQRGEWNPATGKFTAHRAQWHTENFGAHLVGDPFSGNIYSLSSANTTDNGLPIRRVRRAPYIAKEHDWIFHRSLELLCEDGQASQVAGTSESPLSLFVADPTGAVWQFEITDAGTIPGGIPAPAGQLPSVPVIADNQNQSTFWQLQATRGGLLTAVNVPVGRADIAIVPMATTGTFMDSGFEVNQKGIVSAMPPQPHLRAPVFDMRYSDDGGHNYTNYRSMSMGLTGETAKRVKWNRLGKSRNRVYEVVDSDPVNVVIVDAFIDADPDEKPTARLGDQMRKMA